VAGADRYRNPDEDLPADFTQQREAHIPSINRWMSAPSSPATASPGRCPGPAQCRHATQPQGQDGERNGKADQPVPAGSCQSQPICRSCRPR
jgi:hypothetical protein